MDLAVSRPNDKSDCEAQSAASCFRPESRATVEVSLGKTPAGNRSEERLTGLEKQAARLLDSLEEAAEITKDNPTARAAKVQDAVGFIRSTKSAARGFIEEYRLGKMSLDELCSVLAKAEVLQKNLILGLQEKVKGLEPESDKAQVIGEVLRLGDKETFSQLELAHKAAQETAHGVLARGLEPSNEQSLICDRNSLERFSKLLSTLAARSGRGHEDLVNLLQEDLEAIHSAALQLGCSLGEAADRELSSDRAAAQQEIVQQKANEMSVRNLQVALIRADLCLGTWLDNLTAGTAFALESEEAKECSPGHRFPCQADYALREAVSFKQWIHDAATKLGEVREGRDGQQDIQVSQQACAELCAELVQKRASLRGMAKDLFGDVPLESVFSARQMEERKGLHEVLDSLEGALKEVSQLENQGNKAISVPLLNSFQKEQSLGYFQDEKRENSEKILQLEMDIKALEGAEDGQTLLRRLGLESELADLRVSQAVVERDIGRLQGHDLAPLTKRILELQSEDYQTKSSYLTRAQADFTSEISKFINNLPQDSLMPADVFRDKLRSDNKGISDEQVEKYSAAYSKILDAHRDLGQWGREATALMDSGKPIGLEMLARANELLSGINEAKNSMGVEENLFLGGAYDQREQGFASAEFAAVLTARRASMSVLEESVKRLEKTLAESGASKAEITEVIGDAEEKVAEAKDRLREGERISEQLKERIKNGERLTSEEINEVREKRNNIEECSEAAKHASDEMRERSNEMVENHPRWDREEKRRLKHEIAKIFEERDIRLAQIELDYQREVRELADYYQVNPSLARWEGALARQWTPALGLYLFDRTPYSLTELFFYDELYALLKDQKKHAMLRPPEEDESWFSIKAADTPRAVNDIAIEIRRDAFHIGKKAAEKEAREESKQPN